MREKVRERKGRVQERKMWALEGKVGVFTGGLDSLCFLRTFFLVIAYFLLVNPI